MGHRKPEIWTHRVGRQNRIRITDADEISSIGFLWADRDHACDAVVGAKGQLQIVPSADDLVEKWEVALTSGELDEGQDEDAREAFDRYVSNRWSVRFQPEVGRKRFSLVLPKGAREIGVAPGIGETAVFFLKDRVLEIWKKETWLKEVSGARFKFERYLESREDNP